MSAPHPLDTEDPWQDDVLDRAALGVVLENHLMNRFLAGDRSSLSLAIDGRWGTGKTFFVERWTQQLLANNRCVITFNAWQHDSAPDPALALMSEMRRQLKALRSTVISENVATKEIEEKLTSTLKSMAQAAKPAAKIFFNGLLKKTLGSSISDFTDAIDNSDEEQAPAADDTSQLRDSVVETYVEQLMLSHENHQASIEKFRADLGLLASAVAEIEIEKSSPVGPIIIIIDELDRCRPTFAVQILEAVKHLFSANNVCFIFSTNLDQLAASVQVIYGSNFSGREYLGRFFDREISLPAAAAKDFSKLLFQNNPIQNLDMGYYRISGTRGIDPPVEYWHSISQTLGLTLRQQQQAFGILVASCQSYPEKTLLPGAWMMLLSQLKASRPEKYNHLTQPKIEQANKSKFNELIDSTGWHKYNIEHLIQRHLPEIGLQNLLLDFYRYSTLNPFEAHTRINSEDPITANEIEQFIARSPKDQNKTILNTTYNAIAAAGMFSY